MIDDFLNLSDFPLHEPETDAYHELVKRCQGDLDRSGLFNLEGFLKPEAASKAVEQVSGDIQERAFTHRRQHNIYFLPKVDNLPSDHPVLRTFETVNHTLSGDQIPDSVPVQVYEWVPFVDFLAKVMGKPRLFQMEDKLAAVNVMSYRDSEALNWHFDRSEFTTTLLLQGAESGGDFQYKLGLRTDDDPNYDGIGEFLDGEQSDVTTLPLKAGTLNVFRGRNTLHKVTPVRGDRQRIITVFSYYEKPGVKFSREEQVGFYGRSNA